MCGVSFSFLAAEMYVQEVEQGRCDGKATPTLIKETPATAYVDGRNAIGTVSSSPDHVITFPDHPDPVIPRSHSHIPRSQSFPDHTITSPDHSHSQIT